MGHVWATLDRFEDDKAVLILSDKQQLIISRQDLDPDLKPGDVLKISFRRDSAQTVKQEKSARKILNRLLN